MPPRQSSRPTSEPSRTTNAASNGRALVLKLGKAAPAGAALRAAGFDLPIEACSSREILSKLRRRPTVDVLAVAGGPATAEIGSFLAPLAAAALGTREVLEIDTSDHTVLRRRTARYLIRRAPGAVAQFGFSGGGIALQRVLQQLLQRLPRTAVRPSHDLERLCYVRSSVETPSRVGGSVTHAHEVIRALRNNGVDVTAVTTDAAIVETASRDVDPPCQWRLYPVPNVFRAIPASLAFGSDIVLLRAAWEASRSAQVIYQRHARFTMAGALLARQRGVPLFLEYNGPVGFWNDHWQPTPFGKQLVSCERAVLSSASRIFVVSEVLRRGLLAQGIEDERIVVNPNGVDADRFAAGNGAAVRQRQGIGQDELVIGFVGSFGPWHGAPRLAEAFAAVAARNDRARLMLVGDGPQRVHVMELLDSLVDNRRVTWVGQIPPSAVPDHLAACDILASPHVPLAGGAEFFGSPTKLFEYIASGKAIVASALGQIGEVLQDGETALLVPPDNVPALTAALLRLADDPDLRERLGRRAQSQAKTQHSWAANAQRLLDAYRSLVR